jgi:hypothetical protein
MTSVDWGGAVERGGTVDPGGILEATGTVLSGAGVPSGSPGVPSEGPGSSVVVRVNAAAEDSEPLPSRLGEAWEALEPGSTEFGPNTPEAVMEPDIPNIAERLKASEGA